MQIVEKKLLQIPNLVFCAKFVGGAYDFRTTTIVADFEDVFHLKKQISEIENIKTAEFYLQEVPSSWTTDFFSSIIL